MSVCTYVRTYVRNIKRSYLKRLAANRGKAAISSPTSVETPLQYTHYRGPSVEAAREQKTVNTVAILNVPAKQDIVLKNQRIVSPST